MLEVKLTPALGLSVSVWSFVDTYAEVILQSYSVRTLPAPIIKPVWMAPPTTVVEVLGQLMGLCITSDGGEHALIIVTWYGSIVPNELGVGVVASLWEAWDIVN